MKSRETLRTPKRPTNQTGPLKSWIEPVVIPTHHPLPQTRTRVPRKAGVSGERWRVYPLPFTDCRKLLIAVLAACAYSWLTIASTTDVHLITNTASSPLPFVGSQVPIAGFYLRFQE